MLATIGTAETIKIFFRILSKVRLFELSITSDEKKKDKQKTKGNIKKIFFQIIE
jgi:hypothetical protein